MSLVVQLGDGEVGETVAIDRHLYLTEDGSRVVEEGDPAGRWLWAAPGNKRPRAEAERLGAVAEAASDAEPEPEPKASPAPPNKARKPAGDK